MKQIQGGIFFPKSSDDASASDALCDSSNASGTVGAGADKECSSHGMIKQPLHYHELADVAKVCANRASLFASVSQIPAWTPAELERAALSRLTPNLQRQLDRRLI